MCTPGPILLLFVFLLESERLADRAPVSAAGIWALQSALDDGAATSAGLAFAAVDPEIFAGVGVAGRPAVFAVVSNDAVAGVFEDVGGEQLSRRCDDLFSLHLRERRNLAKWAQTRQKTYLRFKNIADSGKHILAQKRISQLILSASQQPLNGEGGVKAFAEHIALSVRNLAVAGQRLNSVHAGKRDAKSDSDEVGSL